MTADTITAIKKALEGVTPGAWFMSGVRFRMNGSVWHSVNRYDESLKRDEGIACVGYDERTGAGLSDAKYIAAVNPSAISDLLSTLESLQRENEELRKDRYDLAYAITGGEDAPGLLNTVPTSDLVEIARNTHRSHSADIDRAMAAEDQMKLLRNKVAARVLTDKQLADEIEAIDEACKGGFGEGGGSPGEWWYERADELEHERKRRELESQLLQHNSRAALSSTGDTHGN